MGFTMAFSYLCMHYLHSVHPPNPSPLFSPLCPSSRSLPFPSHPSLAFSSSFPFQFPRMREIMWYLSFGGDGFTSFDLTASSSIHFEGDEMTSFFILNITSWCIYQILWFCSSVMDVWADLTVVYSEHCCPKHEKAGGPMYLNFMNVR